ncbi:hypothetical protein AAMO2058_001190400 [Amorphochlora amoebiformis]
MMRRLVVRLALGRRLRPNNRLRRFSSVGGTPKSSVGGSEARGVDGEAVKESLGSLGDSYNPEKNVIDLSDLLKENSPPPQVWKFEWWGTERVGDFLDIVHDYTELAWIPTIVACTVALRLSLFPISVLQAKAALRLMLIQPYLRVLKSAFSKAKEPMVPRLNLLRRNLNITFRTFRFSPTMMAVYPILNIGMFFTFVVGVRNIVLTYPEFTSAGYLWFTNLQEPDPYMILPIVAISGTLASLELGLRGRRALSADEQPSFSMGDRIIHLIQGFVIIMAPVTVQLPAGVFTYWITSSIMTISQILLLRRSEVRNVLGIVPPPEVLRILKRHQRSDSSDTKESNDGGGDKGIQKAVRGYSTGEERKAMRQARIRKRKAKNSDGETSDLGIAAVEETEIKKHE